MKPILFNAEMVRAILDGRKTVTRRVVKTKHKDACGFYVTTRKSDGAFMGVYEYDENESMFDNPLEPPFKVNDILYVRETWTHGGCAICEVYECYGCCNAADYLYKADFDSAALSGFKDDGYSWRPSIHMPKEAARIFLKVTGVRVERLQEITEGDIMREGIASQCFSCKFRDHVECSNCTNQNEPYLTFALLWNDTIKDSQRKYYSWDANPYVWVIEFEVIDKAALQKLQGTVGVMMVNKLVEEGQA